MKKLFVLLLLPILIIPAAAFQDVPSTHWAAEDIDYVVDTGLMKGIGSDNFDPDGTLTYAQFITILVREFYPDLNIDESGPDWSSGYIEEAEKEGLLTGISMETPHSPIPRFDMALVIDNLLGLPQSTDTTNISDWEEVPAKYQKAVSAAYGAGILRGRDAQGTFAGYETVTRGEASRLARSLARVGQEIPDIIFRGYGAAQLGVGGYSTMRYTVTGYEGYNMTLTVTIPQPFPFPPIVNVHHVRPDEIMNCSIRIGLGSVAYFDAEYSPEMVGPVVGAYINKIKLF